ncbi:MAG: flippase-like domain-containing protein [Deltaproteobacteria bacterium]|nr:flippase-like domain-containing protein [Deltaproteobacteria bacterium]
MQSNLPFSGKQSFFRRIKYGSLGVLIGLSILLFCLYRIGFRNILSNLSEIRPMFLVMAAITLTMWILLGAMNMVVMLRPLVRMPFALMLGLYSRANMIALVVPGQVGDAVIIKFFRKFSVPISQGTTIFGIDKLITMLWYGIITIAGFYLLGNEISREALTPKMNRFWIHIAVGFSLVIICFALYMILRQSWIWGRIRNWIGLSFTYINLGEKVIFADFCITFFRSLLLGCAYWFAIRAYGPPSFFIHTLCFPIMAALVAYIPISFNGLGTVEVSLVFLFDKIGLEAAQVISAALTLRVLTIFLIGIGALITIRTYPVSEEDILDKAV